MPKTNKDIEKQLQLALDSLSEQTKPNITKTAREFAVPMHRLRRRWKGGKSLFQRAPNGRKLNPEQEQALCDYIDYFDTVGASINRRQIAIAADSILENDHTDPTTPAPQIGAHWLPRFLKRHPEYYVRRRRALDIERATALDKSVVERWFEDYKQVITEHGICQQDIYNFDETGFQIGVGRDQFIITRHPKKKPCNGSVTNRESVTVLEAVSADGFVCPPLIVLSARQVLLPWFDAIDSDEHLAVTDTGYINDTLAYQWIQLFHKWTIGRTIGTKRLVLCDRFGSHLTRQFIQFCEKNNIILFFLLSHTSHILQPLDVGVLSVYKHWHSEAVEAATMTGCRTFSKDEFLYAIGEIRRKTFRPHTIKLGFKLTGLWPINSKLITDELESYDPFDDNSPQSNTPSIASQNTEFSTPKTAERIRRISYRLNQYDPTTQRFKEGLAKLAKLAKGTEAQVILALQLQREFDQTQAIMGARHARYDTSRRHIPITGIINSTQVKEMKYKEYKLSEKAHQDKTRRKWKKVLIEIRKHGRAKKRRGD
ncbi:Transposon, putative [Penicillium digitatum Pd1]|uniref:Transposon, putative n=1 Tax=Penicillium digitatum (strain Pd1 / CECT 20795) TaxID=1170230 RepID=K9G038_PEND1|nr:Transposon, putative [Penicillium digitatum Pd1]EKV14739.1 Transposon, putative [Penicillium digitatum Pd1]